MSHVAPASLVDQLGSLFEGSCTAGLSDRQLLERFTDRGGPADEAAFAAIVARHGPMVLGVCRQLLGDRHHAEDAFQATFFVLARRAGSIRDPDRLGPWLYGVALRTARQARGRYDRRRRTEEDGAARQVEARPALAEPAAIEREQAEALHREIDRLPGSFRLPVVLCYFEGLTLDEAARRLRWPVGTLRSRLARAREKLRRGLTRRGFALSAAAMAAALAPRSASASVSPLLCDTTTRAAIRFAAPHAAAGALAAPAAAMAQEVLRIMILHKLKTAVLPLMLLAVVAAGAGWLARPLAMGDEPKMEMKGAPAAHAASTAAATPSLVNPARIAVTGRVLDPEGKPIANARVAVLADRKWLAGDRDGRHRNILTGTAAADAEGRFTLEMTAPAASRLEYLGLIAAAPGRALTAIDLKTDVERQETSITLLPEKPIEGRLVDVQGQPAAGIAVRVAKLNFKHEFRPYDAKGGPVLWPSTATTDSSGRFRISGLGADAQATYEVDDPRYAHQEFSFQAGAQGEGTPRPGSTITLRPARAVEVHVVYSDDGKPAVGAPVSVLSVPSLLGSEKVAHGRTDGQGRARVVAWPPGEFHMPNRPPQPEEYQVRIDPPEGEPYLHAWRDLEWPKGAVQQSCEFKLRRGVLVRGRVIEDPAGTPVADARVTYHQRNRDNPRRAHLLGIEAVSKPDGTFTMVVPRGPGNLIVRGSSLDYVHIATSYYDMGVDTAPWFRMYADAHARLDVKDDEATHPVEIRLRRGVTVKGRVVGPDGRPVAEAFLFGRSYTPFSEYAMSFGDFNGDPPRIAVKDGRFEIPGCDPDKPSMFYFLDLKDRLGATVELSGKSATAGPVTVQLRPTATIRLLLKDKDGKLLANYVPEWPIFPKVVITPGPEFVGEEITKTVDQTAGDYASQVSLFPYDVRRHRSGPDGRVTMINLIPGAPYRCRSRYFTPEPGQTIDLGEVVIAKPPG